MVYEKEMIETIFFLIFSNILNKFSIVSCARNGDVGCNNKIHL